MPEDLDVFEEAIAWRIKNIDDVAERDGDNPFTNGQKAGFQYAVAIYKDCKKREVITRGDLMADMWINHIWICPMCDEVYELADVDPDWAVHGCPACHDETKTT
jgi:rubrerythrin